MNTKRRRRILFEELESRLCPTVPPLYPGTPFVLPQGGDWTESPFVASPLFADLDGDGKDELLVSVAGGKLIAYKSTPTGVVPWQVYDTGSDNPASGAGFTRANIKATPVVVNLPNGHKGIFASMGFDETNGEAIKDGRVFGWDALTGQILPGWPQDAGRNAVNNFEAGTIGPLASGDLLGDGQTEIVVTSHSTFISAFRLDGSLLWRFENDDTIESGAVVADIDRDGKAEVVYTSGISPAFVPSEDINYPAGGLVTVLNGATGTIRFRVGSVSPDPSQQVPEVFFPSPVLADLFGDGNLEIIAIASPHFNDPSINGFSPAAQAAGNRVYAFDNQGHLLPGWPYHTTSNDLFNHQTFVADAVADLLGDGRQEVIHLDQAGFLHVIQANGQALPGWAGGKQITPSHTLAAFGAPIVADVDGDGHPDIVVSDGPFLTAFDRFGNQIFQTAAFIPGQPLPEAIVTAAAVGQFDGQGGLELASLSNSGVAPGRPSLVRIFQLPPSSLTPPWPMYRRSAAGMALSPSLPFDANYVVGAFRGLLGRNPTVAEGVPLARLLQANQFTTLQLAQALANSPEARGRVVDDAFRRYLNRAPNPLERVFWVNQLAGMSANDLALTFLNSTEFFRRGGTVPGILRLFYQTILGRDPSQAEFNAELSQLFSGVPLRTISAGILNSNEAIIGRILPVYAGALGTITVAPDSLAAIIYDLHHGASESDVDAKIVASGGNYAPTETLASWIHTLYRDLVGRDASPGEIGVLIGLFDSGALTMPSLAYFLLNGDEGHSEYIREIAPTYLGRPADPALIASLKNFARREDAVVGMVSSDEYFFHNGGTVAGYVQAVFRDLGGFVPSATVLAPWIQAISAGAPRASLPATLVNSALYQNLLVVADLFRYLPDESMGVLPTGILPLTTPGQPLNPNPALVAAFVGALQHGARDEDVIVALVTNPQYISRSEYDVGFYRHRGVRN
jgi:hypothetical protein